MRKSACGFITLVVIYMVIISAGCSKTGDSTGKANSGPTQNDADVRAGLTSKSFPEKLQNGNVNLLLNDMSQWDSFQPAIKLFEEKYGGKVNYELTEWGQLQTKLIAMISSGDSPDVVFWNQTQMPGYAIKNILQPVDDLFDLQDPLWYYDSIHQFQYKGKHYGVCGGFGGAGPSPFFVYFNKTLFEDNGVKTPMEYCKENNWNWNTLKELGQKMTADTDRDGTIDQWGFYTSAYMNFVRTNGTDFVKINSDGSIALNTDDPRVIEALKFYQDSLLSDKYEPATLNPTIAFPAGKLAMVADRHQFATNATTLKDSKYEWDIVPFPTGPSGVAGVSPANCGFWGIPSGAKNPKGSAAFLYCHANTNTKDDLLVLQTFSEEQRALMSRLKSKVSIAQYEGIGSFIKLVNTNIKKLMTDGYPIVNTLEEVKPLLQAEIDLMMKEAN